MALLQAAAREHIPIDPSNKASLLAIHSASQSGPKTIPDPEHRPSIDSIVSQIQTQDWYEDQILYNRTFEPKEAQVGGCWSIAC